jgi:hypothetical protein
MKKAFFLIFIILISFSKGICQESPEFEHLEGMEIYLFENDCINENSYIYLNKKKSEQFAKEYTESEKIPLVFCKNYIDLENCKIENDAFLSHIDIEYYNWNEKTIYLTESGKKKLNKLIIPVQGTPYVIKVKEKVFYGAWLWYFASSEGCDRVYSMVNPNTLKLKLNFGIGKYKCGKDPRNNSRLLNALLNYRI